MAGEIVSDDQYFTTAEVAKLLKLNPFTVLGYIRSGKLGAVRFGKCYRVAKRDINDFIARNYSAGGADIDTGSNESEQM